MSNKSLSSGFLVALLSLGVLVAAVDLGAAQTSNVKGILSSDTSWTKAGSPYVLTGAVGIPQGVTLTIEPGVTVEIGEHYIQVNGTLYARGTSNEKIYFNGKSDYYINNRITFTDLSTSWNEQTGTGSIIENAVINYSPIRIGTSSPKICNNYLYDDSVGGLIHTHGGSPIISYNTMKFSGNGIDICEGSSPPLHNNVLEGQGNQPGHGINAREETATISNNIISNCGTGIIGSHLTIEGNTIKNNKIGIETYGDNPIITGNVIQNNEKGISGGGIIMNNSIVDNVVAIENSVVSSEMKYNNILSSSDKSVYMTKNWGMDATYNWWGTTDANAIEQMIHDVEDDIALGKATFEPFLTEPNPAIEPIQAETPTPTPTSGPSTQETQLTLSCSSSTSNFQVEISGRLTANGAGVTNAPITLSYSIDNGVTWVEITTVNTDWNGNFALIWVPTEPANYLVKAAWEDDAYHSADSTTVSFALEPFEQNVFSVTTNSILRELFFDSPNNELRFSVEGPDGTIGYAKVYVDKAFLNDISALKVRLDDEEISYTIESNDDAWIISFSYTHSTHQVAIKMGSTLFDENQIGQALVIGLPLAVLVMFFAAAKLRNRKTENTTADISSGESTD